MKYIRIMLFTYMRHNWTAECSKWTWSSVVMISCQSNWSHLTVLLAYQRLLQPVQ